MKSYEVLKRAIPDGKVEEIAKKLGVHGDTVRRWRREPESDDTPTGTGRANPLDRMEILIDAVLVTHPSGAHAVASYPKHYYEGCAETLVMLGSMKSAAAEALSDAVRAFNAINLDEPLEQIEAKLAEVEASIQEVRRHVRVAHAGKNGCRPRPADTERDLKVSRG
jgi:hypothetical protein